MSDSERTVFAPRAGAVSVGTTLNGIYEVERLIAVGGMGEVYKGRAIQTGDAVAIKMIRPELARDEAALALFRREARPCTTSTTRPSSAITSSPSIRARSRPIWRWSSSTASRCRSASRKRR